MFLAVFISPEQIWFFQLTFSSNNTPKNLTVFALSVAVLAIFNSGMFTGILSCEEKCIFVFF